MYKDGRFEIIRQIIFLRKTAKIIENMRIQLAEFGANTIWLKKNARFVFFTVNKIIFIHGN